MRGFLSYVVVVSFVMAEPGFFMNQAHAAGKCSQHKQKIQQGCPGNQSVQSGSAKQSSQKNVDKQAEMQTMIVGQGILQSAMGDFGTAKAQCSEASQKCQSDCDKEAQQKMKKKDMAGAKKALQQSAQCKQEEKKQNAKNDSAMADIAKLLAAIAALIAAMKGNDKEDPEEIATNKEEEEEDICDTPEGAILVSCQGESDPLASRASLNGATGVASAGGQLGQTLSRPIDGEPSVTASDSNNGSGGSFGQAGGGGFAAGGFGASAAAVPVRDAEKGADKDIYKGFINSGAGGGGGGGAAFSGGGAKKSQFKPFSFNDPLAEGQALKKKKKKLSKAGLKLKGSRFPASSKGGKGNAFQDNFAVIKRAYKQATPSLEH